MRQASVAYRPLRRIILVVNSNRKVGQLHRKAGENRPLAVYNNNMSGGGEMLKSQKGFTLIELVMIIVILGILAAVAIPKYIDLTTEATGSANMAYIGAVRSAISMEYAKETVAGGGIGVIGAAAAATIAQIEGLVVQAKPTALVAGAGTTCGATTTLSGKGKLSNTAAADVVWTLTCGAAGEPLSLVSAPAGY